MYVLFPLIFFIVKNKISRMCIHIKSLNVYLFYDFKRLFLYFIYIFIIYISIDNRFSSIIKSPVTLYLVDKFINNGIVHPSECVAIDRITVLDNHNAFALVSLIIPTVWTTLSRSIKRIARIVSVNASPSPFPNHADAIRGEYNN